uniref:Protein kinase domain-containing protein n=1 Tax=Macrostomum lignano TaxID=282301 RepID=A0A1I8F776_9PLAT
GKTVCYWSGPRLHCLHVPSYRPAGAWHLGRSSPCTWSIRDVKFFSLDSIQHLLVAAEAIETADCHLVMLQCGRSAALKRLRLPYRPPVWRRAGHARLSPARFRLRPLLGAFAGCAAIGCHSGHVMLIDLRLDDDELGSDLGFGGGDSDESGCGGGGGASSATGPESAAASASANTMPTSRAAQAMPMSTLAWRRRLRRLTRARVARLRDAACDSGGHLYCLLDEVWQAFSADSVSVTALHYSKLTASLLFSSPPVSHFVLLKADDDPMNLLYLWICRWGSRDRKSLSSSQSESSSNGSDPVACVHYDTLVSAGVCRSPSVSGSERPANPPIADLIHCDNFFTRQSINNDEDLSRAYFVWTECSGSILHVGVFDLNRWYQCQLPRTAKYSLRSLHPYFALTPIPGRASTRGPEPLRRAALFYPASLGYRASALHCPPSLDRRASSSACCSPPPSSAAESDDVVEERTTRMPGGAPHSLSLEHKRDDALADAGLRPIQASAGLRPRAGLVSVDNQQDDVDEDEMSTRTLSPMIVGSCSTGDAAGSSDELLSSPAGLSASVVGRRLLIFALSGRTAGLSRLWRIRQNDCNGCARVLACLPRRSRLAPVFADLEAQVADARAVASSSRRLSDRSATMPRRAGHCVDIDSVGAKGDGVTVSNDLFRLRCSTPAGGPCVPQGARRAAHPRLQHCLFAYLLMDLQAMAFPVANLLWSLDHSLCLQAPIRMLDDHDLSGRCSPSSRRPWRGKLFAGIHWRQEELPGLADFAAKSGLPTDQGAAGCTPVANRSLRGSRPAQRPPAGCATQLRRARKRLVDIVLDSLAPRVQRDLLRLEIAQQAADFIQLRHCQPGGQVDPKPLAAQPSGFASLAGVNPFGTSVTTEKLFANVVATANR